MEQPILSKVSAGQPLTAQAWNALVDHIYTNKININKVNKYFTKTLLIEIVIKDDPQPDLSESRFIVLHQQKFYGEATLTNAVKIDGTTTIFEAIFTGLYPVKEQVENSGKYELICQSRFYKASAVPFKVVEDEQAINVSMELKSLFKRRMPSLALTTVGQFQNIFKEEINKVKLFKKLVRAHDIYGHKIENITKTDDDTVCTRTILVQQPAPGTPLFEDSEITLVLSASPVTVEEPPSTTWIPEVIGENLLNARKLLKSNFLLYPTYKKTFEKLFPLKDSDLGITGIVRRFKPPLPGYPYDYEPYEVPHNRYFAGSYYNPATGRADKWPTFFNFTENSTVTEVVPSQGTEVAKNSEVDLTVEVSRASQISYFKGIINNLPDEIKEKLYVKLKNENIKNALESYHATHELSPIYKQPLETLLKETLATQYLIVDKELYYRFCVYFYKYMNEKSSGSGGIPDIDNRYRDFRRIFIGQKPDFINVLSSYANKEELQSLLEKLEKNIPLTPEELFYAEKFLTDDDTIFVNEKLSSTESKLEYILFVKSELQKDFSTGTSSNGLVIDSILDGKGGSSSLISEDLITLPANNNNIGFTNNWKK